jgi:hypothetical protein
MNGWSGRRRAYSPRLDRRKRSRKSDGRLAVLGEKICRTPEEWKAYSQNFGHSSPMTTFNSCGPVAPHRQAEILNALVLAKPDETAPPPNQSVTLDDDQVLLAQSRPCNFTKPAGLTQAAASSVPHKKPRRPIWDMYSLAYRRRPSLLGTWGGRCRSRTVDAASNHAR